METLIKPTEAGAIEFTYFNGRDLRSVTVRARPLSLRQGEDGGWFLVGVDQGCRPPAVKAWRLVGVVGLPEGALRGLPGWVEYESEGR